MFLEPNHQIHNGKGWIEVITGSMFSGKTEELIRRINRVKIAGMSFIIFKPRLDNRYAVDSIVSHDQKKEASVRVQHVDEILELSEKYAVVCIDEAQFFAPSLVQCCIELANEGKRVMIAGLDMDFKGEPFGPVPQLMAIAEYVTKLHAICMECGELATFSYRKSHHTEKIMLGEKNEYTPLCRNCFHRKKLK